jgi:hypothetical protein
MLPIFHLLGQLVLLVLTRGASVQVLGILLLIDGSLSWQDCLESLSKCSTL